MTDPNDPFDTDGFPEVVPAGPASTHLPVGAPEGEVVYDTGSDAWWRAQATAQREAAEQETPAPTYVEPPAPADVEPPALVEPTVLLPVQALPSPLDNDWEPEVLPGAPEPESQAEPEVAPIWAATPAEAVVDPAPDTSYAEDLPRERPEPPTTPVGPLQAAAGAGIAVLGVALAVGALFVFNHHEDTGGPAVVLPSPVVTHAPSPTTPTQPTPTAAASTSTGAPSPTSVPSPPAVAPVAAAPIVPVSVLNNSKIKGLAKTAAADFRAAGWPVPVEGNYRGTIATTTVYYAQGQRASADRFAKQFGIPRVEPRFAGLPTKGMTVVVTRDYR